MRVSSTAAVAALTMVAGTAMAQAPLNTNLLQNPNFETPTQSGAFQLFDQWNSFNGVGVTASGAMLGAGNQIEGLASAQSFGPTGSVHFQNVTGILPGDEVIATMTAEIPGADPLGDPANSLLLSMVGLGPIGNLVEAPVTLIDGSTPVDTQVTGSTPSFIMPFGVDGAQLVTVFIEPNPVMGVNSGSINTDLADLRVVSRGNEIPFYNGGFEADNPFQRPLFGWQEFDNFAAPDGNLFNIDTTVEPQFPTFEGTKCAFLFGNFAEGDAVSTTGFFQDLAAAEGEEWTAEIQVRNWMGFPMEMGNVVILSLQFLDASENVLLDTPVVIADENTSTMTWTPGTATATAPANTERVRMTIVFSQAEPDEFGARPDGGVLLDAANLSMAPTGPQPCNAADIAAPFGQLDLSDVQTFLIGFGGMDPVADIAGGMPSGPDGMFDLQDVQTFLIQFGQGCPL